MKTLLLLLALTVPASARIEKLLKQGTSIPSKEDPVVFVPIRFEPCTLVWQVKHAKLSREVTIELADLDASRFRVEPLKDRPGIVELWLYTLSDREVIREQTIYPDNSRTDLNHKSRHVLLLKNRSIADKLKDAFATETAKCVKPSPATQ